MRCTQQAGSACLSTANLSPPGGRLFVSVISTCQRLNIKLPSCRAWCGAILEPSRSPLSRVRQPWLVSRPRDNEGFPEATPSPPPRPVLPVSFRRRQQQTSTRSRHCPACPLAGLPFTTGPAWLGRNRVASSLPSPTPVEAADLLVARARMPVQRHHRFLHACQLTQKYAMRHQAMPSRVVLCAAPAYQ